MSETLNEVTGTNLQEKLASQLDEKLVNSSRIAVLEHMISLAKWYGVNPETIKLLEEEKNGILPTNS